MKKIYSSFKSKTFLLALSFLAFSGSSVIGQTCPYPIAQNFDPPGNNPGSTAGFTGAFVYGSTTSGGTTNGYLVHNRPLGGSSYTLTSPTYKLANNATFIALGFALSGTEKVGSVQVKIAYVSTSTGSIETHPWGSYTTYYNGSSYQFCDQIFLGSLTGFTAGGSYRFQIDFAPITGTGSVGQTITVDSFATNGIFSASPLPVTFTGFDAKKVANGVQVSWKVAGEENVNHYEVERSTDGRDFSTIASEATSKASAYAYLDATATATVYYRIKNVDNDGKFKYSNIVRIANGTASVVITAFPQPVVSQLTVQHPVIKAAGLITISTADGRIVNSIKPTTGSMQTYIDMSKLQKGLYVVRFNDGEGTTETMKVIKQ